MATFALVHGGFAGGWIWQTVRGFLEASGHQVYTPTLTGLGERSHLISPILDLETHIQDVVNVLRYEELTDVILVANTYGGMVITGVADRVPERIRHLVYVDAFVPRDGESMFDLITPSLRSQFLAQANTVGDGWRVEPVSDGDPRRVAQPLKTLRQPITIDNPWNIAIRRTFVRCVDPKSPSLDTSEQRVRSEDGWEYRELETGNRPALLAPRQLADLLLDVADSSDRTLDGNFRGSDNLHAD
jgi:pimeloyl-ACP methyl ester carboxylesterase